MQKVAASPDENSIANTLVLLGNVYQDFGDHSRAIDLYKQAAVIFERILRADSPILAELFYNLGIVQSRCDALADAQSNLERSVLIYRRLWAKGHPDRVAAENELRRVVQLRPKNMNESVLLKSNN